MVTQALRWTIPATALGLVMGWAMGQESTTVDRTASVTFPNLVMTVLD
jgi:hypothetical protein